MAAELRSTVLARGEDSGGRLSVVEIVVPAGSAGPPLHRHDFDEAFYVLEGELVLRVADDLLPRTAGQLALAPRGAAHALANRRDTPARFLLVCTPAGFERHFARLAAQARGTEPPPWALQPVPDVEALGPPILQEVLDTLGGT
jgi:quercetin dioxygenase-like cupin family protein